MKIFVPDFVMSKDKLMAKYFLEARKIDWNQLNIINVRMLHKYKNEGLLDLFIAAQPVLLAQAMANKTEKEYVRAYTKNEMVSIAMNDVYSEKHMDFLRKLKR